MLYENKSRRALLVIDMTAHWAHRESKAYVAQAQEIVPFIQGELQYFRDRMRPIIFCNTSQSGSIIRELSPRAGEICLEKKHNNAFLDTNLGCLLRDEKIKTLTIVGLQLYSSILLSAAAALEHGFHVVVPETCVGSDCELDHLAALRLLNRWIKKE